MREFLRNRPRLMTQFNCKVPGRQSGAGRDWSQTRNDGALGASAVRRQNCQFARRKVSSSPGIFCLMAACVGLHSKRGIQGFAIVTSGMSPVRLIHRQADSPFGATDTDGSPELPITATPAKQDKLSAKSPGTSNGPCIIATNPKAIHIMTKIGFTRGTRIVTTGLWNIFQEISPTRNKGWEGRTLECRRAGLSKSNLPDSLTLLRLDVEF